ncbi:CDP-diacylglycerol--glycerol-3-phosphate 3-phosphatidyltransferase [Actinopolymorpha pittospori]
MTAPEAVGRPAVTELPKTAPSVWNGANVLTVLRVVLVPVFGWLLLQGGGDDTPMRIAALVVFLIAAATDRFDGELARRYNLVTDFGKIADPLADKALVGMALVGLSILGELPWWVTALILVREFGITLMRFLVIRTQVIAASSGGKAKTVLQTLAIVLYLLPFEGPVHIAAMIVMGLAVVLTVVTGIDYVVKVVRPKPAQG